MRGGERWHLGQKTARTMELLGAPRWGFGGFESSLKILEPRGVVGRERESGEGWGESLGKLGGKLERSWGELGDAGGLQAGCCNKCR